MPAKSKVVCFHRRSTGCHFCWPGGRKPSPKRTRLRCPCCGRFTSKVVLRCARCAERGFVALSLF